MSSQHVGPEACPECDLKADEVKQQLANLRTVWANAPLTAKAVAGAYITPLLDVLDGMNSRIDAIEEKFAKSQTERSEGING